MNVLIIGSGGFLGKHIHALLKELRPDITIETIGSRINCDCTKKEDLCNYNKNSYDYIFHCVNYFKAYDIGSVADEWINNVLINTNIVWWWKNHHPEATLITFGTDACYPEFSETVGGKKEYRYCSKMRSYIHSGYSESKRNLYFGLKEVQGSIPTLKYYHFILTALFGEKFEILDSHFVHKLIRDIAIAKDNNKKYQVDYFNKLDVKEITYVVDIAYNILALSGLIANYNNVYKTNIFNVGAPSKKLYIDNYLQKICNLLNYDCNDIVFTKHNIENNIIGDLNSGRAIETLNGDYKDTNLDICLYNTVQYYLESRNLGRKKPTT